MERKYYRAEGGIFARLEDLTFPKNRKRRETTRVRSPNLRICAVDANDITRTYGPQSIRK